MKNYIQSIFIVSLILLFTSANAQQFGIKSQYNYTQKTELREYKNTNLLIYWCTPQKDFNAQWIYIKYKKHQIDISFNAFKRTLDEWESWRWNYSQGEKFNVKEFNFKYNYFFSDKVVQPFAFATGRIQHQNNNYFNSYSDATNGNFYDYFNHTEGTIYKLDLGLGVLFQKNNFGFYVQFAAPVIAFGQIKNYYQKKEYFQYDNPKDYEYNSDINIYLEHTENKPVTLKPKDIKLQSSIIQTGFQYQLYTLSKEESATTLDAKSGISFNVGFTILGINYSLPGLTANISIKNSYQIGYFWSNFRKYTFYDYFPNTVKQECIVVSKVFHQNKFRFSAGLGGQILNGRFNTFTPLMYSDVAFMLGKNARIGLIFSRGFLPVNSQPEEAVYTYFPVSAYFQIPLFSSDWFKEKSE